MLLVSIDWDEEGPNAHLNSNDIWRDLRAASEKDGAVAKSVGDIAKRPRATGERLDAAYELPFLAHATMEPINATVHVTPDSCEIWIGTQVMTRVQLEAAKAAGLSGREGGRQQPSARRRFWTTQARGRHGGRRRAHIAKQVRWAGQGGFDPRRGHAATIVSSSGLPRHLHCRDAGQRQDRQAEISRVSGSVHHGALVSGRVPERRVDIDGVDSAIDMPSMTSRDLPCRIRAGRIYRCRPGSGAALGLNNNVFAIESFIG